MYDNLIKRLQEDKPSRRMMLTAADAIENLSVVVRAQKAVLDKFPKWIPVAERLPREQETVLTWGKQGVILFDWRHDSKWCCFGDVTHWMPLPEPPKEGEA